VDVDDVPGVMSAFKLSVGVAGVGPSSVTMGVDDAAAAATDVD